MNINCDWKNRTYLIVNITNFIIAKNLTPSKNSSYLTGLCIVANFVPSGNVALI